MRLLVVTQVVDVNDPVLGFFHRWLEELARTCESVEVVCLYKGTHTLPSNVRVHSLGKEEGKQPALVYAFRFLSYVWRRRKEYDRVLVHMNPEYVLLAGVLWNILGKRTVLWYTHKRVDMKLRIATALVTNVCTASPESFRLKTPKLLVMGHGIDTGTDMNSVRDVPSRIISVGRIAPAKNLDLILDVFELLREQSVSYVGELIGGPATPEEVVYARRIEERARALSVTYHGPLPHAEALKLLTGASIFVSASSTGSVDKAVLEASAAGVVPLFVSEAFETALGVAELRMPLEAQAFAREIETVLASPQKLEQYAQAVRARVQEKHELTSLIPRLVRVLDGETSHP